MNKRIRAYEEEKARLTSESQGEGVKALGAKNMLAQIDSGPLKEELNKVFIRSQNFFSPPPFLILFIYMSFLHISHAYILSPLPSRILLISFQALITAEAAVRIASKKFGGSTGIGSSGGEGGGSSDGAIWWMNRDLEEKKKRYGPKAK